MAVWQLCQGAMELWVAPGGNNRHSGNQHHALTGTTAKKRCTQTGENAHKKLANHKGHEGTMKAWTPGDTGE